MKRIHEPAVAPRSRRRYLRAGFHRLENVIAAAHTPGYNEEFRLDHCIAHPTDGAMGYHCVANDLIEDLSVDPLRPEGLVYAPGPNGKLKLAAVEYIVPAAAWDAGNTEPPSVLGWTCTSSTRPWAGTSSTPLLPICDMTSALGADA